LSLAVVGKQRRQRRRVSTPVGTRRAANLAAGKSSSSLHQVFIKSSSSHQIKINKRLERYHLKADESFPSSLSRLATSSSVRGPSFEISPPAPTTCERRSSSSFSRTAISMALHQDFHPSHSYSYSYSRRRPRRPCCYSPSAAPESTASAAPHPPAPPPSEPPWRAAPPPRGPPQPPQQQPLRVCERREVGREHFPALFCLRIDKPNVVNTHSYRNLYVRTRARAKNDTCGVDP